MANEIQTRVMTHGHTLLRFLGMPAHHKAYVSLTKRGEDIMEGATSRIALGNLSTMTLGNMR